MVDWNGYLESICTDYAQWWEVYTLTEVMGKQQQKPEKIPLLFDFGLMVQTVEREQEARDSEETEEKERIERLGVLEGLRKYAPEHVLLVGRPGSGKSTALERLLLEEAQRRKAGEDGGEIPVLVKLRYYHNSILDLIQDFLQQHQPKLEVDGSTLKNWLRQGQLLLLVDGVNELPSQQARQDLHTFRQNYRKTTPMVFTTRDLGVGGDLDITKKLEMQPLSEGQMQQFVRKYLPEQGEQMLKQLGSRLREFGQTPLLLMMLCSVFAQNQNKVPANLGSVFRQFTQIYNDKLKQDIPVSQESRRWWQLMLEQLAWVMTCGEGKTQLQVAIPRQQAEAVLMEFLQGKIAYPEDCALNWLEDLLNHHLIQLRAGEQIEFRHQLLQEYYTAEYLLKLLSYSSNPLPQGYCVYTNPLTYTSRQSSPLNPPKLGDFDSGLPQNWGLGGKMQHSEVEQQMCVHASPSSKGGLGISDEELKREYLNYLKWTEPLALMLELVENKAQAVRVVKLALEVDWRLGARLAGVVKPKFQKQTVGLVAGLEIPQLLKIQLLGITSSESAVPPLIQALKDQEDYVRSNVVEVLGKIGTETAIPALITVLQYGDLHVRLDAAEALKKIGTEAAIFALTAALQDQDNNLRSTAAEILGEIGTEAAIPALTTALQDQDDFVRRSAAYALGEIGTEATIPALTTALQDQDNFVRRSATYALAKISTQSAITALITAVRYDNDFVRWDAAEALGQIDPAAIIHAFITELQYKDVSVHWDAAEAREKIDTEATIDTLIQALQHEDNFVRSIAAYVLGKIGIDTVTHALIHALKYKRYNVRISTIEVIKKIGTEVSITALIHALQYGNYSVRRSAAEVLELIGTESAISGLTQALKHEDYDLCRSAAQSLGKIGAEAAIPDLTEALQHQDTGVRRSAAEALGKIGIDAATPALIQVLREQDNSLRRSSIEALGEIGTEAAISALISALQHEDHDVCRSAAKVLGKIGTKAAIPALIQVLYNEDYSVSLNAAEALGTIGIDAATPALIKVLQEQDNYLRSTAIESLGKIGTKSAIFGIIKALQYEDFYLRSRAAEVLGKIGTESAIPALIEVLQDKDNYLRWDAAYALYKIGTEAAIFGLTQALEFEDNALHWNAAEVLEEIGTEAAIPALIQARQDQEDDYLNWDAAYALYNIGTEYVLESTASVPGKIDTEAAITSLIQALQDEESFVRSRAAEALGKIGTEATIPPLVQALKDGYYGVRQNAAEALGKIGTEAAINQLVKALKQENFVTPNQGKTLNLAINALEQIQERCQLYNPTLSQLILTPEPQPYIPSIQLMYILHLSDLHITTLNQATLWSNQLAEDLHNELEIPHLDALILSGDIANYSTPEEYQAAEQFLNNLRQDFPLEPEQIIIVPGNHDLNWKQAKKAYNLVDREEYEGKLQAGHYIKETDTIIRVRDEESYKQRFIHFSQFYQAIANQSYPLDYDQQGILYHLPQQNLLILGLNSAWQLDHYYKSRASINMNALSNALTQIRRNRDYDNCLKIAVWHHPLSSAYEDRITDAAFLEQLAVAGFRFFLHGHIHEAKTSNYRYDMSQDGRKLDQICAGTFGAPTQELVTGTPWQYNLLQFEPDKLTVRTRRRTKENGSWEADSIWRQGRGSSSLDYYMIDL
ncbi:MAG: NACHT domain-containing protein [Symploca sp. SIO2C1]|nr:NACHT domain-containing protein [Symploca sp. SIO2C1]